MRKKTGIFLSVWLCISMLLLLLVSTPVRAKAQNMVALYFIGAFTEYSNVEILHCGVVLVMSGLCRTLRNHSIFRLDTHTFQTYLCAVSLIKKYSHRG